MASSNILAWEMHGALIAIIVLAWLLFTIICLLFYPLEWFKTTKVGKATEPIGCLLVLWLMLLHAMTTHMAYGFTVLGGIVLLGEMVIAIVKMEGKLLICNLTTIIVLICLACVMHQLSNWLNALIQRRSS